MGKKLQLLLSSLKRRFDSRSDLLNSYASDIILLAISPERRIPWVAELYVWWCKVALTDISNVRSVATTYISFEPYFTGRSYTIYCLEVCREHLLSYTGNISRQKLWLRRASPIGGREDEEEIQRLDIERCEGAH